MSEGYYEEPMKWTMRESTYENQRRDGLQYLETRRPKTSRAEKICRYYELTKITNATILIVVVGSAVISLICLVVLVQTSHASNNDFSAIRMILSEIKKNITSKKTATAPATTPFTKPPKNVTCNTMYNDKCFRLVEWTTNLSLSEARDECQKINGKLANIYDYAHFEQIARLLRDSIPVGGQTTIAWTGMTVDSKTRRMILSDFTLAAANIPWYPGRLFFTKMPYLGIRIRSTRNLYARGMYDARSRERFITAICETAKTPCPN